MFVIKKRKQTWFLVALMSLMLLLVACSNDEESNSDTEGNSSTEQSTTPSDNTSTESTGDGLSGTLEIQYFVGGYGDGWWKQVIGDFQKQHPDLEIVEHAGPNINTEMNTRWISETPPDVVYIDGAGASETQMIAEGQLMDISEFAKGIKLENGTPLLDSFISPAEEVDGGKIYSLPLVFDTWGTWYDTKWFEENGWEVPTDFDSWISSMEKIKADTKIAPFVTTGQHTQYFHRGVLNPAFAAAGGEELLNDLNNGVIEAWKKPETLEVLKKVEKIAKAGVIDSGFAAYNHTQSQMNFLMHKNAYIPVGFWLPNEMKNDTPDSFEFGFTPTPMNDPGQPLALVPDIRTIAIAEKAKNPEAAKAFLEFIFTEEYAQAFAESTGAIMNMKDVDLSSNTNVQDFLKNINEMINNPGAVHTYKRYTPDAEMQKIAVEITNEIKLLIIDILLGEITAEEFVDKMVKKAEELRK
ncbi:extracellular solute-binding protein [Solibacillus isronensis]|uniref:extracellular solute-binding protein n=1 Tax=Solibacillus isronensis TaxID=412383 RepID=UPI0039A0A910